MVKPKKQINIYYFGLVIYHISYLINVEVLQTKLGFTGYLRFFVSNITMTD